ncbi:hypothetical protein DSO57_1012878 [Entomophthora muscae]|uniref:Uncharacterized protein n=1 Tax=Entomophthora muscae TaxID=34485 RepID=A0ACC2TTJ3_9FUNG|nr:hypothetical protein DSO57_1012878 [Entomophthora muscae]
MTATMILDSSTLPTLVLAPLVSPHSTLSIVAYTSMYYVLTYFAGSFGRYIIHTKVFWWLMTIYPVVTAIKGFQLSSLLPYLLQVVPTMSGYYNYTPEKILELDTLPQLQSAVRFSHQGMWIFSTPKLFRGKFNYLPAYKLCMEPPVTPKPMPASSPSLPTDHTSKLFGIVYITLTGVIETIILAAGLWSWVGKSFSYLFKLAPLLWWALPAKNLAQVAPENSGPAAQDWIPDTLGKCSPADGYFLDYGVIQPESQAVLPTAENI